MGEVAGRKEGREGKREEKERDGIEGRKEGGEGRGMREEKRTQRCNGPGYVYILVVGAVAAVRIGF